MKDLSQINRPWIESLGGRCHYILQMPRDQHFALRVSAVAFVNAAWLKVHKPGSTGELWRSPSDATDRLAEECIRDQLQPLLADDKANLGFKIRTAVLNANLPRVVTSWQETADVPTRSQWLVARLCNLGLEAHEWADALNDRLSEFYDAGCTSGNFICDLFFHWERDGYDFTTASLVHEYMHFAVYNSAFEAHLMAALAILYPQLGTAREPVWNVDNWMRAGWEAGELLAKSPGLPRVLRENSTETIDDTIEKFGRFRLSAMQHGDLVAGCTEHFEACGFSRGSTYAAPLCLSAFDYAAWMRVQRLIDLPATMEKIKTEPSTVTS